MVMKIRLAWYDKRTENLEAEEYSMNFEDDESILIALGLDEEPQIYAGGFDILPNWIGILQPHFKQVINPRLFDYQISFSYQGTWPPQTSKKP